MAANFNFGEVILQALANERAREMQNKQLDMQQGQFDETMMWNKQKWLEGEKQLLEAQIAEARARGEAIPEQVKQQWAEINNRMMQFNKEMQYKYDYMGEGARQFDAGLAETSRHNKQTEGIGWGGQKLQRDMWEGQGETRLDPSTNNYYYRYNSGQTSPDIPIGDYSDNSSFWNGGGVTMTNPDGKVISVGGGGIPKYKFGTTPVEKAMENEKPKTSGRVRGGSSFGIPFMFDWY